MIAEYSLRYVDLFTSCKLPNFGHAERLAEELSSQLSQTSRDLRRSLDSSQGLKATNWHLKRRSSSMQLALTGSTSELDANYV